MVVTIVEGTGTSMEMKAKAVEALESEFAEHTHLNKEEFREMFRTKNKGSGSDRASKMLKYARLLQEDCCASIQYNCDNHITESAYEKLQEAESRIENCEKVIKSAYTMQSKSASRKLKLKKCAEKWQKKHITLQNILDIKFATYNYEAGIATLEDYEQILKLAEELKDDSTVTAKLRKKLSKLVKRMKDGRNFRTLIAYVTILKEISEYQKWGQLEKASAFERKQEIEKLGRRIEILRDETRLKLLTEKYIEMVDLNTEKLKNCKIKMSYMKMTQKQIRKDIKKKVKDFGDEFLKAKREIHAAEDPDILEPLSDFFDMRNWNAASFDPELHEVDGHENGIEFKQEVEKMLQKLEEGKDFYADLEATKVKLQAHEFLLEVMNSEQKRQKLLLKARNKKHIIDQWKVFLEQIPEMKQQTCFDLLIKLVKRSALAPNSQAGVERANSTYNLFKNSLTASMQLPIIQARLRIKINGPPLSLFEPSSVRKYWLAEGHQVAQTVKEQKLVIDRIRKQDSENYTCKIFQ